MKMVNSYIIQTNLNSWSTNWVEASNLQNESPEFEVLRYDFITESMNTFKFKPQLCFGLHLGLVKL
jgi:hypothetical protein